MAIDWDIVKRVLVVRLRSIGDAVLATACLTALREHLPAARIDVLLEDWVAPVYDGLDIVDNVISVKNGFLSRLMKAAEIHRAGYDLVIDLHGGPTAAFFVAAAGAAFRIGYRHYRFPRIYNICPDSAAAVWPESRLHSAEQQLALLAAAGIQITKRPRSRLTVTGSALESLKAKIPIAAERFDNPKKNFALIHPAAAFDTKRWPAENFAILAEHLHQIGLETIAVAGAGEREILNRLAHAAHSPLILTDALTLPEISALASRAAIFVGNDSGIAHMAAAVGTPCVVIFGSSNRDNWRPWTDAPNEIVFTEFDCQPCPGYVCEKYQSPQCILSVSPESVIDAVDRVLAACGQDKPVHNDKAIAEA